MQIARLRRKMLGHDESYDAVSRKYLAARSSTREKESREGDERSVGVTSQSLFPRER